MAGDKSPRKVRVKRPGETSSDLFTDEPVKTPWEKEAEQKAAEADLEYEPAPETEMDFMTVEEEKTQKKNVTIGIVIGILIAAFLIGAYIYHNQSGKIRDTAVSTSSTSTTVLTTGAIETTTRTYVTQQLTIHKDKNGVWRSYAGLEPTVGYTGVVGNDTGWWYVENDLVNFKYNGIASNDYGTWLIENGKVNEKFSGKYVYDGLLYYIEGGKVVRSEKLTTTSRKPTSATTKPSTTASTNTTGTTASTTAAHEHKYVAVYDGNAIVEDMARFCQCPECGLKFKDRELLESHAYAMKHTLSEDPADDAFNTGSDKQEVIVGYTNTENTYWVCTICGKTTKSAEEAGVGL